jgi:predicted TIM-barrel enzyme
MKQEIRKMKKLLIAVAFAALVATPALAKTHSTTARASDAYAFAAAPDAVIVNGQVVGADPDPNIRFQIERDHGLLAP